MFVPLDWLVLFFFIILVVIFVIIYEINSKFKFKSKTIKLEEEVQHLKNHIQMAPSLKEQLAIVLKDIKDKLTHQQYQVFIRTVEGLSSNEMATELNISPRTVDSHIKLIVDKFKVEKRSQIAGVFFDMLKEKIDVDDISEL
ncbi:MAG: helix-turn-helix transcriptional regulator [Rickettsiaceae bacterium]|nr:helix-turn-helix transcriptional regulator [Rickettsiaceae bacterium]